MYRNIFILKVVFVFYFLAPLIAVFQFSNTFISNCFGGIICSYLLCIFILNGIKADNGFVHNKFTTELTGENQNY